MATTTINSASPDDCLDSDDSADYGAARAGTGDLGVSVLNGGGDANILVGQGNDYDGDGHFFVLETLLHFDLFAAGLTSGSVVTVATLSLNKVTIAADDGDWTIQARTRDWGATLTTGDWVAGDDLGGLTLLASKAQSAFGAGYSALTESGSNFVAACNVALAGSGVVRLVLCSASTTAGTEDAHRNYLVFTSRTTANPPKLDLTYTTVATGTLTQTLGTLVVSAVGTVAIAGTFAQTLAALTSSAAGTVAIVGTVSQTLEAVTSSAAGAVAVVGSVTQTLGDVTCSAAASVPAADCSLSVTLGDCTSSAAGQVAVVGAAANTLGDVTASASGTTAVVGSASVTLDPATLSASATAAIVGALSATLEAVTAIAAGVLAVTGSLAVTLGALTLTGTASGSNAAFFFQRYILRRGK